MAMMTLTKNYRAAAEAMAKIVKDATTSEAIVAGRTEITVEGVFEQFDRMDMDMWGGHMRFVFRDNAPESDEDAAQRGEIAMMVPTMAALLTAPTGLTVHKMVTVHREVTTWEDGRYLGKTDEESQEWRDVTEQFHKKTRTSFGWDM